MPSAMYERIETEALGDTVLLRCFRDDGDQEPEVVIEATFRLDGHVPVDLRAVRVQGASLKPSALQRLPWVRLSEMADAAIRAQYALKVLKLEELKRNVAKGERAARAIFGEKERPGRKPLSDDFYRRIAVQYLQLRKDHVRPIAAIAEEMQQNKNTVAGWVKKARARGYLPPARTGRAG